MGRAIARNLMLHLLAGAAYLAFWKLDEMANIHYIYSWRMASLIVPCILMGAVIYLLDLSNRACNAVFLTVNLIVLWLAFRYFPMNDLMYYMSILLAVLFLAGVAFPKRAFASG